jgi:hypothetical protein
LAVISLVFGGVVVRPQRLAGLDTWQLMVGWSMCLYLRFFRELGHKESLNHWPAAKKSAAGVIGFEQVASAAHC